MHAPGEGGPLVSRPRNHWGMRHAASGRFVAVHNSAIVFMVLVYQSGTCLLRPGEHGNRPKRQRIESSVCQVPEFMFFIGAIPGHVSAGEFSGGPNMKDA